MKTAYLVAAAVATTGTAGYGIKEATSSCMVGVVSADATITIKGVWSSRTCQQIAASSPKRLYVREEPAEGSVLCEHQRGLLRYVVRDQGLFKIVGRGICEAITTPGFWDDLERDRSRRSPQSPGRERDAQ